VEAYLITWGACVLQVYVAKLSMGNDRPDNSSLILICELMEIHFSIIYPVKSSDLQSTSNKVIIILCPEYLIKLDFIQELRGRSCVKVWSARGEGTRPRYGLVSPGESGVRGQSRVPDWSAQGEGTEPRYGLVSPGESGMRGQSRVTDWSAQVSSE